ncbi:MAG TPA: hypothetical protein PKD37_06575 [Oligoflexia bacterium]|nr:hypothetical protein [Oligoflexia bacterium]HMP27626.1 hypothetical protein [Oligoflexia bacterium]
MLNEKGYSGQKVNLLGFNVSGEVVIALSSASSEVPDSLVAINPVNQAERSIALPNDKGAFVNGALRKDGDDVAIFTRSNNNVDYVTFVKGDFSSVNAQQLPENLGIYGNIMIEFSASGDLVYLKNSNSRTTEQEILFISSATGAIDKRVALSSLSLPRRYRHGNYRLQAPTFSFGSNFFGLFSFFSPEKFAEPSHLDYYLIEQNASSILFNNQDVALRKVKVPSFFVRYKTDGSFYAYQNGSVLGEVSSGQSYSRQSGSAEQSIVRISPSGEIEHINCFISPLAGSVKKLFDANRSGDVFTLTATSDGNKNLAILKNVIGVSLANQENYCLRLLPNISLSSSCGHVNFYHKKLRTEGFLSFYRDYYVSGPLKKVKAGACKMMVDIKNANSRKVNHLLVALLRRKGKLVRSFVLNRQAQAEGRFVFDLAPILNDKELYLNWSLTFKSKSRREKQYRENSLLIIEPKTI